ncbi:unnamed protein product, partial [Candidula unifasciata]
HNELMRLLIYSGFNPKQKDNFGQTALHLACINGNLTAVKELCEEDGVEVNLPDNNGKTPLQLAIGRKHDAVVNYLKVELQDRNSLLPRIDWWAVIFGPPGNSKGALLFLVLNLVIWGYPMYIFKCLPLTWNELQVLHIVFMFTNVVMWICLYHANTVNPGYLPQHVPEYDQAIKQVAHFDEWKQGQNPLSRLCHTCRTVKPLRAKHCRICNRCVREFDHHCPYIHNCVGYYNRVWFLAFVCSLGAMAAVADYLCLYILYYISWDWLIVIGSVELLVFTCVIGVVVNMTIYHAANNLTTNERINRKRYDYLKDGKGAFYNPFNKGLKKNLMQFLHLEPAYSEDDVHLLGIHIV